MNNFVTLEEDKIYANSLGETRLILKLADNANGYIKYKHKRNICLCSVRDFICWLTGGEII